MGFSRSMGFLVWLSFFIDTEGVGYFDIFFLVSSDGKLLTRQAQISNSFGLQSEKELPIVFKLKYSF